jgi:hypothetical protein
MRARIRTAGLGLELGASRIQLLELCGTLTRPTAAVENEGMTQKRQCHARESGHPDLAARAGAWIPAYAGVTQR